MDKNLREELLKPFWEGNRVLFESAMLVGEGDGAPLMVVLRMISKEISAVTIPKRYIE